MGVVLVDMTLSLREGDSKRGAVWQTFPHRSMRFRSNRSLDALHLPLSDLHLCCIVVFLSFFFFTNQTVIFALHLTYMLLAAVGPKTKTKF